MEGSTYLYWYKIFSQRLFFWFTQMLTTIAYHLYLLKAHSAIGYMWRTTVLNNTQSEKKDPSLLLWLLYPVAWWVTTKVLLPLGIESKRYNNAASPQLPLSSVVVCSSQVRKSMILSFKVCGQVHHTWRPAVQDIDPSLSSREWLEDRNYRNTFLFRKLERSIQSLSKTKQKLIVCYFLCVVIFLKKNVIGTILWTTKT